MKVIVIVTGIVALAASIFSFGFLLYNLFCFLKKKKSDINFKEKTLLNYFKTLIFFTIASTLLLFVLPSLVKT